MPVTHLDDTELTQLAGDLRGALPPFGDEGQRIAVGLYRLLAEGAPVDDEHLVASTGASGHSIAEALAAWPGVFRDDDGYIIGFGGLTVVEMPPHAFHVNG